VSITVIEHWRLKQEFADKAFEVMQEMDDLLEENAHKSPGWAGHARFFKFASEPTRVMMVYAWETRAEHERLLESETALLKEFVSRYCSQDREVEYAEELPVDV
jgi:heme-degrading monooxygenase HmoA